MAFELCRNFEDLTPDRVVDAVENALGVPMAGFTHPLASYINRVYEMQQADGTRIVAKFYRPGRWERNALEDEHRFVLDCAREEIPVVPPLQLVDGGTLGEVDGIFFVVYPKRRGREWEAIADEDWRRLGNVIGRVHMVGARQEARDRVVLDPARSTAGDIRQLLDGGFVSDKYRQAFSDIAAEILDVITPLFEGVERIRLHGDCHGGNILDRPGEGLIVIDFDDMATGPPVQDLWMLLPDHADQCRREINLILEGYELFCEFDDMTLRLIEPLRVMRLLYFAAWVSRQTSDPNFRRNFPTWGDDAFWNKEVGDLRQQLTVIREHLR